MTTDSPQPASKLPWLIVGALGCGALVVVLLLGGGFLAYLFLEARPAPSPSTPGGPAPAGPTPEEGAPARVAPRAGFIRGVVHDERGRAISAAGAKVTVQAYGTSLKGGEKVVFRPPVDAEGHYETPVPDGLYQVFAQVEVSLGGKVFHLRLDPVDGKPKTDQASANGIVKDFVWRLSGLRPGFSADQADFTSCYGATVMVAYDSFRPDLKKNMPNPPPGTKVTFSLVPRGLQVDGNAGKTLTFERTYDAGFGELTQKALPDIPLCVYTISAFETFADGSRHPLAMRLSYGVYADSVETAFLPEAVSTAWPLAVGFARTE